MTPNEISLFSAFCIVLVIALHKHRMAAYYKSSRDRYIEIQKTNNETIGILFKAIAQKDETISTMKNIIDMQHRTIENFNNIKP